MGDEDNRVAARDQINQQLDHPVGGRAVEVAGRFVRPDHRRCVHERPGHGHALLLATGQLVRSVVRTGRRLTRSSRLTATARASRGRQPRLSSGNSTFSTALNTGNRLSA